MIGLFSFSGAVTALTGTESTSGLMMVALSSKYTLLGSAVDVSFLTCSTKSQIAEASMSLGLTRPSVICGGTMVFSSVNVGLVTESS